MNLKPILEPLSENLHHTRSLQTLFKEHPKIERAILLNHALEVRKEGPVLTLPLFSILS